MTNAEKYTTTEERTNAFREYCNRRKCTECPNYKHTNTRGCGFAWLDFEAEERMTVSEVVNILAEYNQWRRCEGEYGKAGALCPHPPQRLSKAIDRAVELIRNIKDASNGND